MPITSPAALVPTWDQLEATFPLGLGVEVVANANPNRVALTFAVNAAGSFAVLRPSSFTAGTPGIRLDQGSPLILKLADIGGAVQRQWFAEGPLGIADLYVLETLYFPERVNGRRR